MLSFWVKQNQQQTKFNLGSSQVENFVQKKESRCQNLFVCHKLWETITNAGKYYHKTIYKIVLVAVKFWLKSETLQSLEGTDYSWKEGC